MFTAQSLATGSLRRVINTSASSGRAISQPSAAIMNIIDKFCHLDHFKHLFLFTFSVFVFRFVFKTIVFS